MTCLPLRLIIDFSISSFCRCSFRFDPPGLCCDVNLTLHDLADLEQALRRFSILESKQSALEAQLKKYEPLVEEALDPWNQDNISHFSHPTLAQQLFRSQAIQYYFNGGIVKCFVTDIIDDVKNANDHRVVASHIFKRATGGHNLRYFGLQTDDVNNVRNCLFLFRPIEQAFDLKRLCFLYEPVTQVLKMLECHSSVDRSSFFRRIRVESWILH